MSLIKCTECGQEISSDAPNCPKCGKEKTRISTVIIGILGGLLIAALIATM